MIKHLVVYLFCCINTFYYSQITNPLAWPMDSPHVFTGNFGELRPNHFHTGLDFSTAGKINFPVYAIADGYVSRIKVSSVGYGRALYITHDGLEKTSLYAHLTSYNATLSKAVQTEQYRKQNYEIEFFPGKTVFRIKKGELIGYSGNSGNSSGPHLHFEIRDTQSEIPLNPLAFYKIQDTVPPTILEAGFYNLADTIHPAFIKGFPVEHKAKRFFLRKDSVTLESSTLGFAFSAFDQFIYRGNVNVTFSAALYLDGQLIYSHSFQHISFNDQRYVNEFSERLHGMAYQKCFLPTLYPQGIYEGCAHKGRLFLADTNYHLLLLLVKDEQGNESSLRLRVRSRKSTFYLPYVLKNDMANCASDFVHVQDGLRLFIPAATLYNSVCILVQNSLETSGTLRISPVHQNLAAAAILGFKPPLRFLTHRRQLVLKNNSTYYIPVCVADSVSYSVYNFGSFQLLVDTVAPKVRLQLSPKKLRQPKQLISFTLLLTDNLSGIGRYNLFVNGSWVPAEYDAKNRLLTYFFNADTPNGELAFKAEIEDRVGNKSVFNYVLKR